MGILLVIFLFVAFIALIKYFDSRESSKDIVKSPYRYGRKEFLMSRSESDFLKVLIEAAGTDYYVFPQVHLSAILEHKIKGQNWNAAFRHINGKSVDYVICSKTYFRPLVAIELDDWSHDAEDRRERDVEVERMLEEVALPLIRFTKWRDLSIEEITKRITEELTTAS